MKRILIPTDFSENSWNAVQYALNLFTDRRTIFLLHINPIPVYSAAGSRLTSASSLLEESLVLENKRCMDRLMAKIKKIPIHSRHTYVTLSETDYFVECIKRVVEELNLDLIVMGNKGASGLKKVSIGSNTGAVITKVKCPLLAIPENANYQQPTEIAFATDFHIGYDIKVLDTLIKMASVNDATLRVLHISRKGEVLTEEQQRNKDFLHDYLNDIKHSFHFLTGSRLENAVQCFVESRDIDMVAMVAKNLNFFQRILFRPAVEEISYHTDIPFLVLHE